MRVELLKIIALTFVSVASGEQVIAQTKAGDFELTPFGAFSIGGEFSDVDVETTANLEDSGSIGLIFDIRAEANTQWEFLYSMQDTSAMFSGTQVSAQDVDVDVHYLQAGGTYLGDGRVARPYLAATIGATHFDVNTPGFQDDTFFSFSIGTGLQIRPNERLGIRLEARLFGSLVQSDSDLFCVSNPGNGVAGCAIVVSGDVLWQTQAIAGMVFRF